MATYFKNLVEATDKRYRLDVIKNAYELLKQVVEYDEQSTMFWRERNEADNEHDRIMYDRELNWATGREFAFASAYKIITGREIVACASGAKDEMMWLRETFKLDDLVA